MAPIGLGLGRVANFINGELCGTAGAGLAALGRWRSRGHRTAPVFRTMCVPRHPSQLYEALLEGVVLFVVMFTLSRRETFRARFGLLTGVFLCGYGIARIIGEYFREPDAFLGFLASARRWDRSCRCPC